MVNAIKSVLIYCDEPMAQLIRNLNASMPESERFIVRMLDSTHLLVLPHAEAMIKAKIDAFRKLNSYVKPH
ncbi:hypothetical protein PR202_gb25200 [Eleusine coracana subsp. coracana]|uniref:General transcription and DNA repair factor IIH subunit TFB5 n=1 Tax=Eleusine coracana subsp. coracana TaxID=191504 RepID=A0AAV5FNK4_ELECO|nr:hypothetical protein QOZ80_5BG0456650 [Eleusine coracana subsp. coracana]GJN36351.1 hypothetical protein PR202_gb25200 [Eleusine coracana subsp. coracana]